MKVNEFLRKSGIMRSGAVAGTYKNAKERPTELMMDGVYDAKKDLVTESSPEGKQNPPADPNSPKKPKPKWLKYTFITLGVLVVLFVLAAIFGAPSAKQVFADSLDEMLQVESVTVSQTLKGNGGANGEKIDLESTSYVQMQPDVDELVAQGKFSLDIVSDGVPILAEAEYRALNGDTYVKFTNFESSEPSLSASFKQVSDRLTGKWIKARDSDNFTSFGDVATSALTTITALPFANLPDEKREEVLEIMTDEDAFTIVESARVEVGGVDAYRYEIEFDKDKLEKAAKEVEDATGYLDAGDGDGTGDIDSLEVWIDINTRRFIKIEYTGTSEMGDITGTINYSDYDEVNEVEKPDEYFIESELLN